MELMDEFEYTNKYGYTETYVMWKTNGFFTRKYDDYKFKMSIMTEEEFVGTEIDTEFEDSVVDNKKSIRVVNTASPTGSDINENIIFIDTLLYKK